MDKFSHRSQGILVEYRRTVFDIQVHEVSGRIGAAALAFRPDSESNDAAGRCSRDQIENLKKFRSDALLNFGQYNGWNYSANSAAVDCQNFDAGHNSMSLRSLLPLPDYPRKVQLLAPSTGTSLSLKEVRII